MPVIIYAIVRIVAVFVDRNQEKTIAEVIRVTLFQKLTKCLEMERTGLAQSQERSS